MSERLQFPLNQQAKAFKCLMCMYERVQSRIHMCIHMHAHKTSRDKAKPKELPYTQTANTALSIPDH